MINCNGCNAPCCRHVIPELAIEGTTICRMLDQKNNVCMDYEHRPDICNTDLMYERYYSKIMTREEYDRRNSEACEYLKSNY